MQLPAGATKAGGENARDVAGREPAGGEAFAERRQALDGEGVDIRAGEAEFVDHDLLDRGVDFGAEHEYREQPGHQDGERGQLMRAWNLPFAAGFIQPLGGWGFGAFEIGILCHGASLP